MTGGRFTEQEAAEIIRRTFQLQADAAVKGLAGGASEEDLVIHAEAAGIDPALLRQAILECEAGRRPLSGPAPGPAQGPAQGPAAGSGREAVRVVEGELHPSEFDAACEAFGLHQSASFRSRDGQSRQRIMEASPGQAVLKLTAGRGMTRVTVRKNYISAFVFTFYPCLLSCLAVMRLAGRTQAAAPIIALLLILGAAAFILARKSHDRNAEALASRTAEALASWLKSGSGSQVQEPARAGHGL